MKDVLKYKKTLYQKKKKKIEPNELKFSVINKDFIIKVLLLQNYVMI